MCSIAQNKVLEMHTLKIHNKKTLFRIMLDGFITKSSFCCLHDIVQPSPRIEMVTKIARFVCEAARCEILNNAQGL